MRGLGEVGPQGVQQRENEANRTVRRRGEEGGDRRGRSGGEKAGQRYGVEMARMAERGATCLQKQGQRLLPVTAPRLP
ncbi:hypothetical protein NDU88_001045 [Pleurodeles waltl]|uniref:Uncharacterized protein n=1 Tax=Pleurodeles waltl TaxID=8319 RepID=A0AAV7VAK4_PLEWA|nr:hypothetical protein NDU88_001045 [Pleurodeles waltl]